MYAEIKSALDSVKIISDLVQTYKELSNSNRLVAAISEANTKLLEATTAALASKEKESALIDKVRSLEQEIMSFKNWEREAQNYKLQAVGAEKSHFAQVYKPVVEPFKERHWACVKCFQEQKLFILNAHNRSCYKCQNCGSEIQPIAKGRGLAPIDSAYE